MSVNTRYFDQIWAAQCQVISRRQLLELGMTDNDIERLVRRRRLFVARRGVYIGHNGPMTPAQREWVAILSCWPSALCHESALPGREPREVHLAVSLRRTLDPGPGIVLHRMSDLDGRIDWRANPPRQRTEHAVIDVMAERIRAEDVAGAYAALTEACFRRTHPDRVLRVLERRARVHGRALIRGMLTDLRDGACSVLERGYLRDVERAHGLPRGERQVASTATGGLTKQDVRYKTYGLVVELNGRAVHDNTETWDADARRDLAELVTSDAVTARMTYGLVFREGCQTARRLETYFRRKGWTGAFLLCPRCPPEDSR